MSILFVTTNCTDEDPVEKLEKDLVCGVADPVSNLKWLNDQFKEFIGGPEANGIVLYDYNDKQVIEVQNSFYNSTNQHQYYCNGEKLNLDDPQAFNEFKNKRIEVKMLYGNKVW